MKKSLTKYMRFVKRAFPPLATPKSTVIQIKNNGAFLRFSLMQDA